MTGVQTCALPIYDLDFFSLNVRQSNDIDPDLQCHGQTNANYYSPHSFNNKLNNVFQKSTLSFLHNNVRSLQLHIDELTSYLLDELNHNFDIIGITETKINSSSMHPMTNLNIPGYKFEHVPTPLLFGGVGMYISIKLNYSVIERISNDAFQAM